jgi:4a-hydroxytetrahydrobiopterin dehydratase
MPLPVPYGAGLEPLEWPADDMDLLPDNEIESRLADLEGWSREGDAITKSFKNEDFVGSVRFVDALVEPAEDMGHHPDLTLSWDEVTVSITNHAAGGLTEADFELAKRIDGIAAK